MRRTLLGRELVADTMAELFDWRLARSPDSVFVRCDDESATYGQMNALVERLVAGFDRDGLRAGEYVACFMPNSLAHVAIMLACARTGLVWAPLNVALQAEELRHCLEELSPAQLFVVQSQVDLVARATPDPAKSPLARTQTVVRDGRPDGGAFGTWLPDEPSSRRAVVRPGDAFCVMYSGGTTGRPKGVVLPHFCAVSCGYRMLEVADLGEDEVFFSSSHLYHALLPCAVIPLCMVRDFPVCFSTSWSASRFVERVQHYEATIVDPFIGMVATLLRTPERDSDRQTTARIAISGFGGSEPQSLALREQFEKRFGIKTYQPYGQTEAGGFVTTEREADGIRRGSSGRSQGWYSVKIVDDDGFECPPSVVGEITVRPELPGMMAHGYLGRAEDTLANWRDLWVHTGDEGYLDEEGFLFFVGRQGHFLRRRGELVSVSEVEEVVRGSDLVEETAVVAVPSEMGEDDGLCAVVWSAGVEPDPQALIDYCQERLAFFKLPRFILSVAELPRTAAKAEVDRPAIKRLGTHGAWEAPDPRRRSHQQPGESQ